jgi:hypothetical protein
MPVLSERRGLAELSRQNQSKEGSESPSRSHCGAQGVSSAQRYERNEKTHLKSPQATKGAMNRIAPTRSFCPPLSVFDASVVE